MSFFQLRSPYIADPTHGSSGAQSYTQNINDSVSATDANSKTITLAKSDSASAVDAISLSNLGTFNETVTISDVGVRNVTLGRSESVTVMDSDTETLGFHYMADDSVIVSDGIFVLHTANSSASTAKNIILLTSGQLAVKLGGNLYQPL